jgi:hypothetical protein
MRYNLLPILLLLLLTSCGGEKFMLELKLKRDQAFRVKIITDSKMVTKYQGKDIEQSMINENWYYYEVVTAMGDKGYGLRSFITKYVTKTNGKEEVIDSLMFDSIARKYSKPAEKIGDKWQAYYEHFSISINGEISDVFATDIERNKKQEMSAPTFAFFFIYYPKEKISIGGTWQRSEGGPMFSFQGGPNCKTESKYKLVSVKDNIAEIEITEDCKCDLFGQSSINQTTTGTAYVDLSTGLTTKMDILVDQNMTSNDKMDMSSPNTKITRKVSVEIY